MKVQEIKIAAQSQKSYNNKTANAQKYDASGQTSFRGVTDALVKFWEGVDRGGLAASFTVQDMLGTNIPRTWAAKDIGKDITGKNNWGAVAENGIREFLTGPSMFVIPGAVLFASTKIGGKSHSVPVQTIKDFSEIIKNSSIDTANKEAFKRTFYKGVLEKAFSNFDAIKEGDDLLSKGINVEEYIDKILQFEKAKSKGLKKKILNTPVAGSKEDIFDAIINMFIKNKKANTTGYPDFLKAMITDGKFIKDSKNAVKFEIKFSDLVERMSKYSDDFFDSFAKSSQKGLSAFVENFTKKRMGGRFATNIAMGALTGLFMWFIPRLYTINKTNPETDPVRQKASELKSENSGNVNFTGGGISKLMGDLGSKIDPANFNKMSNAAAALESKGINVARPLFYTVITSCTLIPRLIQSTKRDIASSKKNGGPVQWDETSNILRRDVTTILTILFAMEGLGSIMAHKGSKKSGVILTSKIFDKNDGFFRKFIDFFNPEGGVQVLSKQENTAQMSNFANLDEVMRYLQDTEKKNGNLHKLFNLGSRKGAKSEFYNAAKKVFGDVIDNKELTFEQLSAQIAKGGLDDKAISELLDILNDTSKNPLLGFANKINAIFQTVSLAIVTGFLGFGLPKINEIIIKNKYLKKDYALSPKYEDPNMHIPDYSILNSLKPAEKQTFQYFLGNKNI